MLKNLLVDKYRYMVLKTTKNYEICQEIEKFNQSFEFFL